MRPIIGSFCSRLHFQSLFSRYPVWLQIDLLLNTAVTVVVDSVFRRRWLWPEGEVLNKRHLWGVSFCVDTDWCFWRPLPTVAVILRSLYNAPWKLFNGTITAYVNKRGLHWPPLKTIAQTFCLIALFYCMAIPRAYRLKKRACNCTPSKFQTVPKNSNSVYCEYWSQAS